MAKQIYIDENGNPIEVSGTINNASMLPISANDSTDTKTYIDSGLSGKQDSLTVQSDIITPSVTGPAIKISKYGKMRQLWVNTQTYSNSGDVQIGTLPNDSKPINMVRYYFGDKSHYISIETDGKIISSNGESYVVANITYIVS